MRARVVRWFSSTGNDVLIISSKFKEVKFYVCEGKVGGGVFFVFFFFRGWGGGLDWCRACTILRSKDGMQLPQRRDKHRAKHTEISPL